MKPPSHDQLEGCSYVRDYFPSEERVNAQWLVQEQEPAHKGRRWANSAKATRDTIRSFLQEEKAEIRRWTPGDWVLRICPCAHKLEPYYDGPFQIAESHTKNVYTLRTVSGVLLNGRYNGEQLFPAYITDYQPVDSLWYGSKRLLALDRERYLKHIGAPTGPPPPVRCRADFGKSRGPRNQESSSR